MKSLNHFFICFLVLLSTNTAFAQTQRTMSYQGVLLNDEGKPIANESVNVSIAFDGTSFSSSGSAVTSDLGAFVVHLALPSDTDFLQDANLTVTTSITSSQGTLTNTSPLSFVPAALVALETLKIKGVESIDSSNVNEIQTLLIEGSLLSIVDSRGNIVNSVNLPTTGGGGSGDDDPNNEVQKLTISQANNIVTLGLTLTGEKISFSLDDNDSDITNEIQQISKQGNIITLSKNGGMITDDVNDADADPENEIQTLSIESNTLSILRPNGTVVNSVNLPNGGGGGIVQDLSSTENGNDVTINISMGGQSTTFSKADADADPENEIKTLSDLSDPGTTFTIGISGNGGNSVNMFNSLPDNSSTNELQNLTHEVAGENVTIEISNGTSTTFSRADADANPTNEAQTLSVQGTNLVLTNVAGQGGGSIPLTQFADADANPTNEAQTLSVNGANLVLTNVSGQGGGTIPLSSLGTSQWTNVSNGINYTGGNVGINTTSPLERLDVNGGIKVGFTSSSNAGTIRYNEFGGESDRMECYVNSMWRGIPIVYGNVGYLPYIGIEGDLYNSAIFMDSGNEIGIGTTNPIEKLHVVGNTFISGEMKSGSIECNGNVFLEDVEVGSDLSVNGGDISTISILLGNVGTINTEAGNYFSLTANNSKPIKINAPGLTLSGNPAIKPGGGPWATTSDKRLKKNIIDYEEGLSSILKINPVKYQYNELSGYDTNVEHIGIIAQDVQKVAPYMVANIEVSTENFNGEDTEARNKGAKEKFLSVDPNAFTYMTINAIQEQQAIIDAQASKIASLESSLQALIKRIEELENK